MEFADRDSAIGCVDELDSTIVLGRKVRVEFAVPTDSVIYSVGKKAFYNKR